MPKKNTRKTPSDFEHGNGIKSAVDVAIFNKHGQILLGKRLSKAGFGSWGFPGGHIMLNESIHSAAKRELCEELGKDAIIKISKKILAVRENVIPPYFTHHITVILAGSYLKGKIIINESEKCEQWKWFDLDKLPHPLFSGISDALDNFKNKSSLIISDWYEKK
ncbi:MAG: NUDIX domain-containing protein [Parcubacteria group bacterium]|jgi:8-oxo-dGTP diphosphatase